MLRSYRRSTNKLGATVDEAVQGTWKQILDYLLRGDILTEGLHVLSGHGGQEVEELSEYD
jgi:hypothetical protein